jgi:hypothetical protein
MAKITSKFKPFIPTHSKLPELTWRAIFLGVILGLIFKKILKIMIILILILK